MDQISRKEAIALYDQISRNLMKPELLKKLRDVFDEESTLKSMMDWIHYRVQFDKEDIIRHNDPQGILEYGRGKCREFSVLFTALCLAHGYRARIILDMSDHAWSEVWSDEANGWIHVDPSERRINDPHMYERDWKKNLKEVYAFENGKIEDVTKTYKTAKQSLSKM